MFKSYLFVMRMLRRPQPSLGEAVPALFESLLSLFAPRRFVVAVDHGELRYLTRGERGHWNGEEITGEIGKPGITIMVATLLDLANRVSILLERAQKMTLDGVKAKDFVVRLRTFIATGDERDTGLEQMSENQLRRIINATANRDSLPPEQR